MINLLALTAPAYLVFYEAAKVLAKVRVLQPEGVLKKTLKMGCFVGCGGRI
jgi:hypothetical protein